MDYLSQILQTLMLHTKTITHTFEFSDLYIHISKNTQLPSQIEEIIIKTHTIYQENPQIFIKQTNRKSIKTFYIINNKEKYYHIKNYGITIILPLKLSIKKYICNFLAEYNINDNLLLLVQIIKQDNQYISFSRKKNVGSNLKKLDNIEILRHCKVLGQFNKQCIIMICKYAIVILDQHAIHERIRLEKMLFKTDNLEYCKNVACKGAIKFGCELSYIKMNSIVMELMECKHPFICAHGRPSAIIISKL